MTKLIIEMTKLNSHKCNKYKYIYTFNYIIVHFNLVIYQKMTKLIAIMTKLKYNWYRSDQNEKF